MPSAGENIYSQLVAAREAIFITDESNRVVFWNAAAERLLGHRCDKVLAISCHKLLRGLDVYGNTFCDSLCPVLKMARRRTPVNRFEVSYLTRSRRRVATLVSVVVIRARDDQQLRVLHVLEPTQTSETSFERASSNDPGARFMKRSNGQTRLTHREQETLRLLAQGATTTAIATELGISTETVRTHLRNVLRKLGCHSRVEAVARALQEDLI